MRTITLAPDTAARWHRGAAVFETLLRRSAVALVVGSAAVAAAAWFVVEVRQWSDGVALASVLPGLAAAIGVGVVAGAVLAFLASPVLALVGALTLVPRRPLRRAQALVGCWALVSAVWFSARVLDNRAGAPYRPPVLICTVVAAVVLARVVPRNYDGALDDVEARLPVV